jgi:uncharacterized membrane protein YdjX (TVP38/TMEM64 family)
MGTMRMRPRHLAWAAAVLAVVLVVVATPVLDYVEPSKLQQALQSLAGHPLLPAMLLGAFVVAGAVFVSVWLVIAQTALFYGPSVSIPLAFAGALLSALTFYGAGRLLGAAFVHRIAPQRVQRAVQGAGLEAMVAVRIVPLLPFTFVNLCAGAFHVQLRTYVLGTILGMGPGIIAVCLLGDQLMVLLRNPTPNAIAGALAAAVLVAGLLYALQRRTKLAARTPEPTQTPR